MSDRYEVPEPLAVFEATMPDGSRIVVRRHGNPDGPRVLLSHGNGQSADGYYPFWSLLAGRFDLFVYDLRSHGLNPVGDQETHNIGAFGDDCGGVLAAIAGRFGEEPVIGVYHSVSALGALLHAQETDDFAALVLFDAPVCKPGLTPEQMGVRFERGAAGTRRRPDRFESREELAESLRRNPMYQRVRPGVPDLLAETVLRPAADGGGFELCCPKEYEALAYDGAVRWCVQVDLAALRCPIKVIGSDPTTPFSFFPGTDLTELIEANYDFIPETSHFLQLEEPEQCAALAIEFLEERGFA